MNMFSVPIIIEEISGINRTNEPVSVGIPFPEGVLRETSGLVLHDPAEVNIPLQTQVLATWTDGSLKWVLLDFQVSVESEHKKELSLIINKSEPVSDKPIISVQQNPDNLLIDTKAASFFVNKSIFKPFDSVAVKREELLNGQKSRVMLTDDSGIEYEPIIENIFVETKGELRTTLKAEGIFKNQNESVFASFFSRISFFANQSTVKTEFTVLNPKAAKHPGGLWDLGDPNSVFFKDISFFISLKSDNDKKIKWRTQPTADRQQQTDNSRLLIYQDSSGGENWKSKNHVNRNNEIKHSFKGYKVYSDEAVIEEGMRANPILSVTDKDKKISAGLQYFWQNFPKALEADNNSLIIRIFPKYYNDLFELQGGEQKTHTIFLDFSREIQSFENLEALIQSPLIPRSSSEWYEKSGVFDYFIPESEYPDKNINELINTAVKGDNTFFTDAKSLMNTGGEISESFTRIMKL